MAEMMRTYLGSVQTWECDANGHMNVQFYVSRALQSLAAVEVHLGIDPAGGQGLAAREHHIRFLAEQHPADPHEIMTGIVSASAEGLMLYSEMRNTITGSVAATVLTRAGLVALDTRSGVTLSADTIAASDPWRMEVPEHGRPRGVAVAPPRELPCLSEAVALGMRPTYQGMVLPEECDGWDWMTTRFYMARVSEAVPVLVSQLNRGDQGSGGKFGGAALEYRLIYRKTPRRGDCLVLYSGIGPVRGKAYNWIHWLCDPRSGEAVATMENVAVTLNLETRRAVDIPAPMMEALMARQVEGLTP